MRVVHDHQEWLAEIHTLKPPGNRLQVPDPRLDDVVRKSQPDRRSDCRKNIVDVDASDQRRLRLNRSIRRLRGEVQSAETQLKLLCFHVRAILQPIRQPFAPQSNELVPPLIIRVSYPYVRRAGSPSLQTT